MTDPELAATEVLEDHQADDSAPTDLDGEPTQSGLARTLGLLPNLLSSRAVILFGIVLFFYSSSMPASPPCWANPMPSARTPS